MRTDTYTIEPILSLLRRRQYLTQFDERLWTYSRTTGWRDISRLFDEASLRGPHANSKGSRHGFVVASIEAGVPLHIVARPNTQTTEIYTQAVAREEHNITRECLTTFDASRENCVQSTFESVPSLQNHPAKISQKRN